MRRSFVSVETLTQELAGMGIPNPFAELGLDKADNLKLFGRKYLGQMGVSDTVTTPHGRDQYSRFAEGDDATSLVFDEDGEQSFRVAPPEGFIYAIVHSPNGSQFWQRLEASVDLSAIDDNSFRLGDEFVATYGAPADAVEMPDPPEAE